MAVNPDFLNTECVVPSMSLTENSQLILKQKTAAVLLWMSRIRARLQELWSWRGGACSTPTIHFYLTVNNSKQRLQANHVKCDSPSISDSYKASLTNQLNEILREFKSDELLSEYPNLVGFWVELKS